MTHEAGGIAVWAHPGADAFRARLEPLINAGLDGVEVKHPSHCAEDIHRIGALVDFFGLVPSGGSDWHGSAERARTIRSQQNPIAWLPRQEAVVACRVPPVTRTENSKADARTVPV